MSQFETDDEFTEPPSMTIRNLQDSGHSRGYTPWSRPSVPFVWQKEKRLLLLDEDISGWVFAELEFHEEMCRYVEIRRAAYDMEREALGALLSRALASGWTAVEDSARSLNLWMIKQYGRSLQESRGRSRAL